MNASESQAMSERPGLRQRWSAAAAAAGLALVLQAGGALGAAEQAVGLEAQQALTVTIYNQDLALVSEQRQVELESGRNRLALRDVSALLRPETVILAGDGLQLVEQGFDADVLSLDRLLEMAVGGPVWVRHDESDDARPHYIEAELVSVAAGPVVRIDGRLMSVTPDRLAFPDEGQDFRDRPTLLATLLSTEAGARRLDLSYLTGGLSWRADYVASLNAGGDRLDLTGLVTLANRSGTAFEAAELRLVAGDVNQVRQARPMARAQFDGAEEMAMAPAQAMAQQAVGEQHLYSLDRSVTLGRRETKQVTLLSASDLPVSKEYRFEELVNAHGGPEEIGPLKAAVVLEFTNDEAGGLGKPLPAGVLRVYQAVTAESGPPPAPLFIGEDAIDHTAEGEKVRITTGRAFDVTGEARRTVFERLSNKTYDTGQAITIRNANEADVSVKLVGRLPRGWRMLEESRPHAVETANQVVWTLPVPAGGEATLTYKLRVTTP